MVIRLKNYKEPYTVVSLSKDEESKDCLSQKGLPFIYLSNNIITFYPEKKTIRLEKDEYEQLQNASSYDVFEIHPNGVAYKYFDNKSLDNAILVTNQCNSNCLMCPTADSVRMRHESYSAAELIYIIKHFPSDAPHITITGGEPFLVKEDMFVLLNYLKNNLPQTEYLLLTNGRAFCSKKYTALFKETAPSYIQLGIPIHGYNAATHDYIVQSEGAFKQTFLGIKNLLSIGAKVELRIVVSKLNQSIITDIAKLIVNDFSSAFCVKIIGLEMTGNAAKNRDMVWIDYSSAFQASKAGINLLISKGIDVGLYNFPLCSVEKEYWNICEKSISDYKIRFAPDCDSCMVKDACGGIFAGTIRLAKEHVNPIRGQL